MTDPGTDTPPPSFTRTYQRADGEHIEDYGWVTGLEMFDDEEYPIELVEEVWERTFVRRFWHFPALVTCQIEDGEEECEQDAVAWWRSSDDDEWIQVCEEHKTKIDMEKLPEIREFLAGWIDGKMREQDMTLQKVHLGSPRCPLVNFLCPDDHCVLPADHVGTEERIHILGTDPYTEAQRYSDFRLAEVGTDDATLTEFGWVEQRTRFPDQPSPYGDG